MAKIISYIFMFLFIFLIQADPVFCQSPEEVWLNYADRLYSVKDYKKASAGYDKVLSIDPENYQATLRKGLCLYYLGDRAGAIVLLEKAGSIKQDARVAPFILQIKKEILDSAAAAPVSAGPARIFALAGAAAGLIDDGYAVDMYAERFTSSYLFRRPSNYAGAAFSFGSMQESLHFSAFPMGSTFTSSSVSLELPDERPADNVWWFSPDNVLVFSPYFNRAAAQGRFVNNSPNDYDLTDSTGIFTLEYAHRLGRGPALGVMAQYNKRSRYFIYDAQESVDTITFDRLSFLLSATWSIPAGANTFFLSAAAGSRRPRASSEYFTVPDTLYEGVFVEGASHRQLYHDDGIGADVDFDRRISVSMYDAWLGAGCSNPGIFDLTAKIFFTPYSKITEKYSHFVHVFSPVMEITLADYERTVSDDMRHFGFDVNGAVYLQWAGMSAGFYSDNFSGRQALYMGNTANSHGTRVELYTSALFSPLKGLNFPLEVRYHAEENVDVYETVTQFYAAETFGYSGGAEYTFENGLSLRAGLKYLYGGMVQDSGPREFSARKDLVYGTDDNPAMTSLEFYGGAGYILGDWHFNLAAGTQRRDQKPLNNDLNAYSFGSFSMILDFRYIFPSSPKPAN